jgi:hypothetical protein
VIECRISIDITSFRKGELQFLQQFISLFHSQKPPLTLEIVVCVGGLNWLSNLRCGLTSKRVHKSFLSIP